MTKTPGGPARPSPLVALAGLAALLALMAAGLVLAVDGVADVPSGLVSGALVVAAVGLGAVVVLSWRASRRSGVGVFRSIGRAIRAAGRLIADLF
ncbi:hypothetical protein ASD16_04940 [Cellulomonas sp. Root485]|uniref:hypothetical protein n=1 Tax=Cellulomonas sp. Root485 TaxID=1736546 RepID=UPI0006FC3771|nr:hypothetical protein [Cellulomonas sp. Root485]KQY24838.1 hypothetical protein ASD16_04940 [Cellulomonas sp. Root485]